MAQLINRNEKITLPMFKNGVTLQFFTITFPSTVALKLTTDFAGFTASPQTYTEEQARSPVAKALEAIHQRVSIEIIGSLKNSGTELTIGVAAVGGDYPTDNYDGVSGNETMAAYLQVLVRAAAVPTPFHQGVNLATATVAVGVTAGTTI